MKINPFNVKTAFNNISGKNQPLEWDESAADAFSVVEGSYEADSLRGLRLWILVLVFGVFSLFLGRLFWMQIINGSQYRFLAESNRTRYRTILAPRGVITDRSGSELARNTVSFDLVAIPYDLPKENLFEQLQKLSALLEMDNLKESFSNLYGAQKNSFFPLMVASDLSARQNTLFETKSGEFPGFEIQKIPIREYLKSEIYSHALGYTGLISKEEYNNQKNEAYSYNDYIGRLGVEQSTENYLHGKNGKNIVEVDATGKLLRILGENSAVSGMEVRLNLDAGLSEELYTLLKAGNQKRKAAAVALNPKTGEVLALISLPGFDNNLFAHGIKQDEYSKLLNNPALPLFNRAIAGTYPPGSTVKPVMAVAALEEHVITERTIIVDRGVLVIPHQFDSKIQYNFYGWERSGLGSMDVKSAIAKSSDIYFYTVGGGHPSSPIEPLGPFKIAKYFRQFGMGSLTGLDIQGEKPGLVPDPDWKEIYYADDAIKKHWYLGDTYHMSIGQGDVLATPLQLAIWTSAIANNGKAYKPKIVKEVLDSGKKIIQSFGPEVLYESFANQDNIKIVQEGMRQTILSGSGVQLKNLPISSAGKTGTSQFDGADLRRTHAWFTAYAPYEDPQIVITVLVEAGGEGHSVAVPVVKETLKWWAENRYKK